MGQNRRAMRWLRWLGLRLLAAAALLTLALTGWHWARGAPPGDALRMMADDYRLLAACPAEVGRVRAFAGRATPDGGPASMAGRHGDGWAARVCDGSLAPDAAATAGVSAEAVRASPSPTPAPASSPTATATVAATVTAAPSATATVAPSPTPTATPIPTATPVTAAALTCGAWLAPPTALDDLPEGARPAERHPGLKRYMLGLINAARAAAGARPVALGGNAAAQLHAEEALAGCFSSHWGRDGLKPTMRYSLAGGYQANGENVSGLNYCITAADGYRAIASPEEEAREAMEGLMDSAGHRRNILDPRHRAVSLGLAWDEWNFMAVQQFEGGYVTYGRAPAIDDDGVLAFSGETRNGAAFTEEDDLGVQVYYDPPPRPLTRGQLARTYCYDSGRIVAALRAPAGPFAYYPSDELLSAHAPCPNPYDVPADAPAPQSHDEAHAAWQAAYDASQAREERSVVARWITAEEWVADGQRFAVTADLSEVLAEHGAGVYSLAVWGAIEGERAVISEYSIFCQ